MKRQLLNFLGAISPLFSLQQLIRRSGLKLFLPFYHSIRGEEDLIHIKHIYTPRDSAQFERDLDYLLKHFEPISLSTLYDHISNKKPFEKNAFFLSFDDGLKEVYHVAAPILERKGVPATLFLNSAFVGNKDLFYRYKASLLIDYFNKNNLAAEQIKSLKSLALDPNHFKAEILKVTYDQKSRLDLVAEIVGLDFNTFLKSHEPYLSKEQITDLHNRGFTFGGHSIDHPFFKNISFEEQIRQSRSSIEFVDKLLGPSIKSFAFPFSDEGVNKMFFERGKNENWLDISFGISGLKKDSIPFHLQRFPIEKSNEEAARQIPAEYLYYFVKSLFGKNTIQRS